MDKDKTQQQGILVRDDGCMLPVGPNFEALRKQFESEIEEWGYEAVRNIRARAVNPDAIDVERAAALAVIDEHDRKVELQARKKVQAEDTKKYMIQGRRYWITTLMAIGGLLLSFFALFFK